MSAILFASHNDDETLFAFYTMLRYKPQVIVVLRSFRQWTQQNGPIYTVRERETACATALVPTTYLQWTYPDTDPDWNKIAVETADYLYDHLPRTIIYPASEMGGHEDHNALASILGGIPGEWEHIRYVTYRRGYGRTMTRKEIVGTAEEQEKKKLALACYESQAQHAATSDWFPGGGYADMREWLA